MSVATTLGPNALGLASMADPTYLGLSTMFGVRPGRGLTWLSDLGADWHDSSGLGLATLCKYIMD
jgi:hypothetical protein